MAEKQEPVNVEYSEKEREYYGALMTELCAMRDERDKAHPELDGMTWIEYWESNRKKDLSYVPPKKNKDDIRIVTGHTREKDTTLLSTQLNMNFEPNITAFDTDELVVAELGDNMSDMVKKSREAENWQKKRPIVYREMDAQGDVFVQELFIEDFREMPLEELDWDPTKDGVSKFTLKTRLQKIYSGCSVRQIDNRKIYLGSMRTEYVEDQNTVAVLNIYKRSQAEARYGKWERWKNVPSTIDTTAVYTLDGNTYKSWNLVQVGTDEVAEIFVYRKDINRVQILLNGVMMLPINYPLTAVSPSGEIPMAQGKLEPISGFALSKSQPSKTKMDQEVLDEVTKLMVIGMRQGRKPPMGSSNKKVLGQGIFTAGKITPDLKKDDIWSILPTEALGLRPADFSLYQLMKQSINDKTVNDAYSGNQQSGDPTATQVLQEKEQQALKLAASIDGVINLERRMTWLRTYNLLANWTKPVDQTLDDTRTKLVDRYRSFSVNTTLHDGQKGVKMFRFTKDQYPDPAAHEKEEQELSKKHGQEVRVVYMDPDQLQNLKYTWFIIINPTPRSNDKLSQLLFVQNMRVAYELFGPEALNIEYVKQRFAILINEDYNKLFKQMDIMQMLQMGTQDPAVQNATGKKPGAPKGADTERALHPMELEATVG